MGNTHLIPDMAHELQATCYDLLPACIVSTSWPTVPVPPSLTLAAFATAGYVKDGPSLPYVTQEAHTVTLTGGDGNYWVALAQDTWTTVASWNRTAGTHYLWRLSATRPADVDGLLVFASLTVSGGAITAVTPAPGVTLAEALRAQAALGTMATQNANAVAITGGSATGLSAVGVAGDVTAQTYITPDRAGAPAQATFWSITAGSGRYNLYAPGSAQNYFAGNVGMHILPPGNTRVAIGWEKATTYGLWIQALDTDTGGGAAVMFVNVGAASVGSITTTATATAYNTSSDVRLKERITTLGGALDVVRAVRPVSFHWQADGSQGHGFLAHELQQVVPEAVSGLPDEVHADGSIKPQQVDHSKLVPWLTACCQALAQQVEALTARVSSLEEQLGL